MCQVHNIYGFQPSNNGGWAEYMTFPAGAIVHRVPDSLPMELAVLVEPLSCALHAVERAEIRLGDVVVVSGAGPIGLGMLAGAKLKGAARVVVLDLKERRLQLARELGADVVLNPAGQDVAAAVLEMTDGYGCDVYFEATGHPSSVVQGLEMIRRLGRFIEFSVFDEPTCVDWRVIGDGKELDVRGAHLGPYMYPIAISLLAERRINMTGVVTHVLRLEEFERAIRLVADATESIKVVLRP
jgi:threonine dehydrogenase-like Zn-dependent dehydrogenase